MDYNHLIDVIKKVKDLLDNLCKNDSFLLQNCANELLVSHTLSEYLQMPFPDWNVDCDYDRKGFDRKIQDGRHQWSSNEKLCPYKPCIHTRNTNYKLVTVQIKNNKDEDFYNFEKLTSNSGKFRHKLVLFIIFDKISKPLRCFENGIET